MASIVTAQTLLAFAVLPETKDMIYGVMSRIMLLRLAGTA
jgi:hypothetical protein